MSDLTPQWLRWAREIQALAQASHYYARNEFERARAERMIAIAAEIIQAHSDLSAEETRLVFNQQPGYVTPKVDVRAAVFQAGELLMVREAMDGGWTLPGGWADVGESPRMAVEREVLEETGYEVRTSRLVGVYDANRIAEAMTLFHAYKLLFLCEIVRGSPAPSAETTQVGFFSVEELPVPLSSHRTTPRHVLDALEAHKHPDGPVVFD